MSKARDFVNDLLSSGVFADGFISTMKHLAYTLWLQN